MAKFIINKAKLEDMDFILSLAEAEGWNPGIHDAKAFFTTDPDGFFVGILDGKKIGCISTVAYNDLYGFLGLYIVVPECRGKGYGIQLWNHAMEYMGNRTIGLDGVVAQQENYKKSHFKLYYKNIRFVGSPRTKSSPALIDLHKIPFESILEYDSGIYGLSRETFLRNWIHMPNAFGLAKVNGDRITGYGIIRSCHKGYKIGPLFAENSDVAAEIYHSLCAQAKGSEVYIDMPSINRSALKLAEELHLTMTFETARMYKGSPPKQHTEKVFGVTSLELG